MTTQKNMATSETKQTSSKLTLSEQNMDFKFGSSISTKVMDYRMPFGKYKSLAFTDIPAKQRIQYLKWIQMKARIVTQLYIGAFLNGKDTIAEELEKLANCGALFKTFFLTFGKYRGIPLELVEIEHPGYSKWLIKSDFSKNLSSELIEKISEFIPE